MSDQPRPDQSAQALVQGFPRPGRLVEHAYWELQLAATGSPAPAVCRAYQSESTIGASSARRTPNSSSSSSSQSPAPSPQSSVRPALPTSHTSTPARWRATQPPTSQYCNSPRSAAPRAPARFQVAQPAEAALGRGLRGELAEQPLGEVAHQRLLIFGQQRQHRSHGGIAIGEHTAGRPAPGGRQVQRC